MTCALVLVVCAGLVLAGHRNDHTLNKAKLVIHGENTVPGDSWITSENSPTAGGRRRKGKPEHLSDDTSTAYTSRGRRDAQGEAISSAKNPHFLVHEASPFCEFARGVITCNFNWTDQTVYLTEQPKVNGTLKRVSIHQVKNLVISQSVCFDLDLEHIRTARVVTSEDIMIDAQQTSSCSCCTTMMVQYVGNMDRLPEGVGSLDTSSSNITEVLLERVDSLLTMSQTNVEKLRVSETIKSHVEVTFYEVYIENLEKLHLTEEATLSAEETKIKYVSDGALVLGTTGNKMKTVEFLKSIQNTSHKVTLKEGAELTLRYVLGNLTVISEDCPPPPPPHPCPKVASVGRENPLELLPEDDDDSQSGNDHGVTGRSSVTCPTREDIDTKDSSNTTIILLILLITSFCLNAIQLLFNQPRNLIDRLVRRRYPSDHQYYNSVSSSDDVEKKGNNDFGVSLPLNKDPHKSSSVTVSSDGSGEVVHFEKKKPRGINGTKTAESGKPQSGMNKRNNTAGDSSATHRTQKGKPGIIATPKDRGDLATLPPGKKTEVPKSVHESKNSQSYINNMSSSTEREINPLLSPK